MKAGFARVEITPGKPMHMAGYDRRQGYSKGCLDPLYVSVVVIGGEVPKFAICSFDLLGVDTAFCDELRQFIENHTFLQGKHVMICATHTHSGPSGIFCNRKNYGSGYADQLLHSGLKAARNAIDDFSETVVSSIPLTVKGVASIRNLGRQQKAQSYEMDAGVLLFSRKKENIRICTFACHPTVLDEQNLFFSRDLPGSAASFMEDGKNTIFLNGPCADLSTRYTRQGSNSEELHRLGKLWGDAVNEISEGIPFEKTFSIRIYHQKVHVPGRTGLSEMERAYWIKNLEECIQFSKDVEDKREYLARLAVLKRGGYSSHSDRKINLELIDLGSIVMLCLPVELRSEAGERYRSYIEMKLGRRAIIVCYAGGYEGYIPSTQLLTEESSYEDLASPFSHKAENALLYGVERLVKIISREGCK